MISSASSSLLRVGSIRMATRSFLPSVAKISSSASSSLSSSSSTSLSSSSSPFLSSSSLLSSSFPSFPSRSFSSLPSTQPPRYTKDHEWVKLSTDGKHVYIGISDYAQSSLGDVVYIELPEAGRKFKKGESFGQVESVKATSSVYSPLEIEIEENNAALLKDFSLVNTDPEGAAWFIKAKASPAIVKETQSLMDSTVYKKHVEEEKAKH